MKKYRVWFEQINEQYIDVHASSKEIAKGKAEMIWKHDNTPPRITDVKIVNY